MVQFPEGETFGQLIKAWRKKLKLSQSTLAEQTSTTTRNLSNLETGKIMPTRQMVKRLSSALELNSQGMSELMRSAGFLHDAYSEKAFDKYQQEVDLAVKLILESHEPYPAMAIDRRYNLIALNKGIDHSYALYNHEGFSRPELPLSLFEMLFSEGSFNESFTETENAIKFMIQRVHREQLNNVHSHDLIEELKRKLPHVPDDWWEFDPAYTPSPALRTTQVANGITYETIGITQSVGSPHDFGGNTTRVILIYPMNAASKEYYESFR